MVHFGRFTVYSIQEQSDTTRPDLSATFSHRIGLKPARLGEKTIPNSEQNLRQTDMTEMYFVSYSPTVPKTLRELKHLGLLL